MVDQGRFAGWAARASEQDLLEQIGLNGTLPTLGIDADSDALAVAFNNAAGNKIDYYLDAAGSYTVTADAVTGTVSGELVIELANSAPATGEPKIVIGNAIGLPDGSNRTWVSVFSAAPGRRRSTRQSSGADRTRRGGRLPRHLGLRHLGAR